MSNWLALVDEIGAGIPFTITVTPPRVNGRLPVGTPVVPVASPVPLRYASEPGASGGGVESAPFVMPVRMTCGSTCNVSACATLPPS